ncbi:serine hydrolase domain-containing protein [uncultured Friedmanniella sp.]|uniref:serine hydrolase domain-containing protein n=1 Tax=uncultured Friedmanniella sp. TaxID=335381 RepID=UPI0035CCA5C9
MGENRWETLLRAGTSAEPRPLFPGAVLGLDVAGRRQIVATGATGCDAAGVPVTAGTLYDLASLTKLVTATVVAVLADRGALALEDRVVRYLPTFAGERRDAITVRQLLTHTAGLPADTFSWRPSLEGIGTPRYSCVGYLLLGRLVEQVAGPLDAVVRQEVAQPLELADLGYRPLDRGVDRDRIAATEVRPGTPDSRGLVHDENAAAWGGVAGNAGLFGTAADVLGFGRTMLELLAGRPSALALSPVSARALITDGLGWRTDDATFMGRLAGRGRAYGHTGFTGTSLVLDEDRDLVAVLLTNRVHPSRTRTELNPYRREVAAELAAAYPLRQPGRSAGR